MPLNAIQIEILTLLSRHRDPESYVAVGIPITRATGRYSSDVDIFHDREERVALAAMEDTTTLATAGFEIVWLRRLPSIHTAGIRRGAAETRLEWVVDSDFRFFPTVVDDLFGYVLHPVDLAINKLMAAAGRRALRDLVDLISVDDLILPLGALAWAAVEKSPGFTPEGLLAEISRNMAYSSADWRALETSAPLDPVATSARLRAKLQAAQDFVAAMPSSSVGLLFVAEGRVVQPDPARLEEYSTHGGSGHGQWPSSAEISTAMWERYLRGPV